MRVPCTKAIRLPFGDHTGSNEKLSLGSLRTRRRPPPFGPTAEGI